MFETQEACALHGDEAVEGRKMYKLEFGGANYQYFCVASANGDEREQVWRNATEQLERDRLKNEKLEANSK